MNINFKSALKNTKSNTGRKFPRRDDTRCKESTLFPELNTRFNIEPGASIFTIDSCFARNIEEVLLPLNFKLPTMLFSAPKSECSARSNGLLNEYNPGTISQRICYALEGKHFPEESIVASGDLYADLMLLGGATDVTKERAVERRNEIFDVYSNLQKMPYVIITLGFFEVWFDNQTQMFINKLPPSELEALDPKRFSLALLDVATSISLLERAIGLFAITVQK